MECTYMHSACVEFSQLGAFSPEAVFNQMHNSTRISSGGSNYTVSCYWKCIILAFQRG